MARFSIVMTSVDRPDVLNANVRAALGGTFRDIEVLVSDNCSKIPVTELLADIDDTRLKIIRSESRLPVSDHWEFAWEHVTGEFVTYLGDKNVLHPDILATADKSITEFDLDIMAWRVCTYFYPDWKVEHGGLPDRGNVLFVDSGATEKLYRCDSHEVLSHFCQNLRMYGCFPCMFGYVFRKSLADQVHARCHGIFRGAVPETSSSFVVLGMCRPGKYAFFDAFGAVAGRPGDSAFASMLSHGRSSQRMDQYLAEFKGRDLLEDHQPKLNIISNWLAGVISQTRTYLPEYFQQYDYDPERLAYRMIDDLYIDRTVPNYDNPNLIGLVDEYIRSLPDEVAKEVLAYRNQCYELMKANDTSAVPSGSHRSPPTSLKALYDFWAGRLGLAVRVFGETRRLPFTRFWMSGGAACIDMGLYGCRTMADVGENFPGP